MEKSLFAISQDLLNIWSELEENGGELTPEIEERLQLTQTELSVKAGNYVSFIKKLENEAEFLKETYQAKIQSEIKKREALAERLRDALLQAVQRFGDIQTDRLFKVTTRKSEAVEIIDESLVPNEFKTFKPVISKTDIKKAIKSGIKVEGAELRENINLMIR